MPEAFDMIDTQERRQEVLELKTEGHTYREIASIMLDRHGGKALPSGWDERYAYQDVSRELEKVQKKTWDKAKEVLMIEIRRLDEMQKEMWRKFQSATKLSEQKDIIETFIKLQKRKAKFLGLDEPEKIEMLTARMDGQDAEGFEWATPDQMPEHVKASVASKNGTSENGTKDE
jgi:hypothetical protein